LRKVMSQHELILHRCEWKDNGLCVVLVSGCFDLLHPGHIRLLERARSLGDVLVVALQGDSSVRNDPAFSGTARDGSKRVSPLRPITPGVERAETLAALAAVDCVVEYDDPTPEVLLSHLAPDIFVKGGMGGSNQPAFCQSGALDAGTKVVFVPLEPGYTTAGLIERMTQLPE
jgi:rfaE bifunctional protein nucleotidyltransferase chain/domain